jgi:hypothetical protein
MTLRPHSSDGEQPLCRRTRADSSPAAGTISVSAPNIAETARAALTHHRQQYARADNSTRPDDKNERYEQRDHRSECEQIFHAGAF